MEWELTGAHWLARLTQRRLEDSLGQLVVRRGADYLRRDMVRSVTVGQQGTLILATVEGSRAQPYQAMIRLETPPQSAVPRWGSVCSCPVGGDCKHVAAVLLGAIDRAPRPVDPLAVLEGGDGPDGRAGPTAYRPLPEWERVLRRVSEPRPEAAADQGLPVGLVFERAEVGLTPASPRRTALRLRPAKQTRTGWGKQTSWADVSSQFDYGSPVPVRAEHRMVCDDLVRLVKRSRTGYYGYGSTVVDLHELGHDLWAVLRRAVEVGMPFLPPPGTASPASRTSRTSRTSAASTVELWPGELGAHFDLIREADGVRVRAVVTGVDDLPGPVGDGTVEDLLLGDPVHGLARWLDGGQRLVLAPMDRALDQAVGDVLRHGSMLVPGDGVGRFLTMYLPRLRACAQVLSSDGSVTLPDERPPRLLVRVAPAGPQRVELRFGFRYGTDGDVADVPVGPTSDAALRDLQGERDLVARLTVLDQVPGSKATAYRPAGGPLAARTVLAGLDAARFLSATLPELQEHDEVVVELAADLPSFPEAEQPPQIEVRVQDDDDGDTDWFGLRVTIRVDDEEVPFLEVFGALARGEEWLMLDSGLWFSLEDPDLVRLRELISESRLMVDPGAHDLRLSRYHLALWEELSLLGAVAEQSQRWRDAVAALAELDTLDAPDLPTGLRATLRPYQRDGYAWLATLWRCGLGGILADDMGLGKTVQALALLAHLHESGATDAPALVVAPTSVVSAWTEQAREFVPDLPVVAVEQTTRRRGAPLTEAVAGASVVITSYAVARLDHEAFAAIRWSALLLDEAQTVKNHRSKTYQALQRLDRRVTLAITGTPLENNLMDLWSLLSLTAPGLYPDSQRFNDGYRKPIEYGGEPDLLDVLRSRIRPLLLRRTKEEVAADLPPKQVQLLGVTLEPRHQRIYQTHLQRERQRVLGLLDDPNANRIAILAALTRLRQLALHPGLVDEEHASVGSAKIGVLVEHLVELAAEGHRALVFSQFTGFLRLVRAELDAAGLRSCYLDGATRDRRKVVQEFRTGDAPAFLISLKAGGVGLTLTEADYVFVLDPWWNPATEAQAIDRAHRIGQDKPVFVYRLVSVGTIEEQVIALQQRKRDLFERVIDDGALSAAITADDIRGLLEGTT